jgi:hypothetical protein
VDDEASNGDRCPFCGHFNEAPAGDTLAHHRAWCWDGTLECSGAAEDLKAAWQTVCDLVATHGREAKFKMFLKSETRSTPALKKLLKLADENKPFLDVLTEIADACDGEGWSTNGMLGGSGFNVYVETDDKLIAATIQYRLLIDKAPRTVR